MVVHEEGEIMQTEQDQMMEVFMDHTMLHCPFSLCPLNPPMCECKGGHLACADYRGERRGNQRQCWKCERGGGFNVCNMTMDAILSWARVECSHECCGLYVSYHKLDDHQSGCALTLCKCLVPDCGYEGPPPALPHYLSTLHPMPVHMIQYGKVLELHVLVLNPRRLLFTEADGPAFFMVGSALGMGALSTVLFICIRAGASPPPHYGAKVWVNGPPGPPNDRTDAVKLEIEVTSWKESRAVAMEELIFMIVPHIRIENHTS